MTGCKQGGLNRHKTRSASERAKRAAERLEKSEGPPALSRYVRATWVALRINGG
jgi:hypothetical protein